ncbi:SDR family oxidoreductase [Pseudoxanthomonas dokdonensis]|uniref:Aklaviketone reductase n=1 Tax=Pseudoxanthomonas dokdonensis TaxID=344882 RepID=A0A0R0CJC2_9GAMM|nr:SDR family oxidoreductase [Pseudoxanthomonas dokdonensis]KRG69996.1 hypothetical protein ABB29_07060 [Pseudoxanthomonas dokdonensis]
MSGIVNPAALVLGAGGTAGMGVVDALLEVGCPVLAVGRDSPRMQALAQRHADEPALRILESGCISDDRAAARLAAKLRRDGSTIQHVFASIATPLHAGRLLDQPVAFLKQKLEQDLLPHLAAARHLLPLLAQARQRNGRPAHYIILGGPYAERGWSGYGHSSITAAAMRMLVQVLHEEALSLGVRVQLLSIDQPLSTPANAGHACAQWPTALAVGRRAVSLLNPCRSALPTIVSFNGEQPPPAPAGLMFADFPAPHDAACPPFSNTDSA